jgi:hypothetical protein
LGHEGLKMIPQVTKMVLNKIILNVWIEYGPVLKYGLGIELAFRSKRIVTDISFVHCGFKLSNWVYF